MSEATGEIARASLRGQRALVTGAGRRVGAAIARRLGAEGMRVAVHYHGSERGAQETCAAIRAAGGDARALQADLMDPAAARALVDEAVEALGGLDLLVPSAANFEAVAFDAIDEGAWERALGLNLQAPWHLVQQAAPALRRAGGSVVFVTCTSAERPFRGYLPYVVSKGAVRSLMRVLALELAPEVRVNAVAPGTVLPPDQMAPEQVRHLAAAALLGRTGTAEDVAEAVAYLAGAPFVTGHELVVDGGVTLR
jgi:pteridine reductase